MKVLVVGSGAREYSIGLALQKSPKVTQILFAPGNGATNRIGETLPISDYQALADYAQTNGVDLTIIGPEVFLSEGIVDIFRAKNLRVFGPTQAASMLESSKAFMKNMAKKANIPTARYIETDDKMKACEFVDTLSAPIVVKADGLCAGKGVIIAQSRDEAKETIADMLSGNAFGKAGSRVVVEEFLDGFELSVFALCDGKDFILLPAAQDHKRLMDGDEGPNTGGMGAYAPTPLANEELMQKISDRIVRPAVDAMAASGTPFEGVLFGGIMVVGGEPLLLEFNVRFGDPECETLMPLLECDAFDLFCALADRTVSAFELKLKKRVCVGVVAASKDYPYKNSEPAKITVDEAKVAAMGERGHISFAGVSEQNGELFATGGRVLVAVGEGTSVKEARDNAYEIISAVSFDGMQFRGDIAYQAL